MKKAVSDSIFALLVFSVLCVSPAQAYLDGATISLVLQAITGAVASTLLVGKLYWHKLKALVTRRSNDD